MKINNRTGAKGHFKSVGSLYPERSVFDLSYSKTFTCDMGEIIPVMCDEVVPGDVVKIGCESVIRFQPLVSPILHEVMQKVDYFFVPYRLMWDEWEDFITGGVTGNLTPTLPRWNPTNHAVGSLWDYLGFPTDYTTHGYYPMDFPRIAYNFCFNEYYRDQTLYDEVDLTNENILNCAWEKDYFTSALLSTQRGTSPGVPVLGTGSLDFTNVISSPIPSQSSNLTVDDTSQDYHVFVSGQTSQENLIAALNSADVNLAGLAISINDLRLASQIQKWLERNNRAGSRYTEFLAGHFGVSPRDDRMMRPEYIGGTRAPIIFSEVLQTSSTDETTPQGNLAGHGMGVNYDFCGKYRVQEYGLIIGLMRVIPKPMYSQGINRQWMRRTKYDFYFREFANLSEQAIELGEVYAGKGGETGVFGYAGRYDEMRVKNNLVCGEMRDTFDYWHIGRKFDSAPALNDTFITCVPRKDIFAVPSEDGLIISFGNRIHALRPMPVTSEPGMLDHF